MPLFDNRQAVNLRACEQMIEAVLNQMGVDPSGSRQAANSDGPLWTFSCGSARVHISLTRSAASEENFIHVSAPVLRPAAEDDARLWRRLLELNGQTLTGAAFGVREADVVITTARSTFGLDRIEVEDMIRRIGSYADLYDDLLAQEFGGTRHCDLPAA